MAHVFIAYSHQNEDFAYLVRQNLENASFQVFMDEDLDAGRDWRHEIDEAIRTAFAVAVIMTPEAKQSEYVTYEWAFAYGTGIPVIPLVRAETELHPRMEAMQHIKFHNLSHRADPWDQLVRVLRELEENSTMYNVPRDAPVSVKRAVAALNSHRNDERMAALDTLAQTDHSTAIEALASANHHEVRDVRVFAGLRLSECTNYDDNRAVPGLLDALRDRKPDVRRAAADALGSIGDASAVPGLLGALHSISWEVRRSVAKALGNIGDTTAVPGLLKALRDRQDDVREAAAFALGKLGDAEAIPDLLDVVLRDGDSHVRSAAAQALQQIKDESTVLGLVDALHDSNSRVCVRAADLLGEIGDASAVSGLLEALNNDNHDVRRAAAGALGTIGDQSAVPGLLVALSDKYEEQRFQSIGVDRPVRDAAAEALCTIGGPSAVHGLVEVLKHYDSDVQYRAITLLKQIGDVSAVPSLIEALKDDEYNYDRSEVFSWTMRSEAFEALVSIGDTAVPGLTERLLSDKALELAVKKTIVSILGEIGTPEALAALEEWEQQQEDSKSDP